MNDDGILAPLATTFASLSLVAIGGATALVPDVHRQVVDAYGWMDGATFASLFGLAQTAPGPNIIFFCLLGWQLAGLPGLVVATISILTPSSVLAFAIGRIVSRSSQTSWIRRAQSATVPIAIGVILAGGAVMARAADHDVLTIAITAGAGVFIYTTARNPLWALGGAAALCIIAQRLGWTF
jgi:chromate transporter